MNIFVLDDFKQDREMLSRPFRSEGNVVKAAADLEEAVRILDDWWPDIALVDAIFPPRRNAPPKFLAESFLDYLDTKRTVYPQLPQVIIVSGQNDAAKRFDEVRHWLTFGRIADILPKSTADIGPNFFGAVIKFRVEILWERQRWRHVQKAAESDADWFLQFGIATRSPGVLSLRRNLTAAAKSSSAVLIMGKVGSGKELLAVAIHKLARPSKPFISVDCGAIPTELFETEMFGMRGRPGNVTYADIKGKFEAAADGVLFLDEIQNLSARHQEKLLRVLESERFTPVGSVAEIPLRAKVVTATSSDLSDLVTRGLFSAALYFRINRFDLPFPTLKERAEDILLLVDQFLTALVLKRRELDGVCPEIRMNAKCLPILMSFSWLGNVRELKAVVEKVAEVALVDQWSADTPIEISLELLVQNAPQLGKTPPASSSTHDDLLVDAELGVTRWSDVTEIQLPKIREALRLRLSADGRARLAAMDMALGPRDPGAGPDAPGRVSQYPEVVHCLKGLYYLVLHPLHRASVQDFVAICQFKAWDPGKKVMQVLGGGDDMALSAYKPFITMPAARTRQEAKLLDTMLLPRPMSLSADGSEAPDT